MKVEVRFTVDVDQLGDEMPSENEVVEAVEEAVCGAINANYSVPALQNKIRILMDSEVMAKVVEE